MSDIAQMDLFKRKVLAVGSEGTLDERFERFIEINGHVYAAFVLLAREYINATRRRRIGAKAVVERMRWEFDIRSGGDSAYAINNSYTSRLARLAAKREADLANAFEFRRLLSPKAAA